MAKDETFISAFFFMNEITYDSETLFSYHQHIDNPNVKMYSAVAIAKLSDIYII